MSGSPETYNSFASIGSGQRQRVRERVMLLGAPLGSSRTGLPGSLAVLASGRSPLGATGGPMIVVRAVATGPDAGPEVVLDEALDGGLDAGPDAGMGGPSLWRNAAPP